MRVKTIRMNVEKCGMHGWYDAGAKDFVRISRWIRVRENYNPSPRNPLWYYAMDGYGHTTSDDKCNTNELYLDYFEHRGRKYAIEQFWALGNPFYAATIVSYRGKDGKTHFLSGVDSEALYDPIYIELDEYGERVRLYQEA